MLCKQKHSNSVSLYMGQWVLPVLVMSRVCHNVSLFYTSTMAGFGNYHVDVTLGMNPKMLSIAIALSRLVVLVLFIDKLFIPVNSINRAIMV